MPSFDVVSTVEYQEVVNAVDQTRREIGTRYDFRGSKSSVELKDHEIILLSEDDMKLKAVVEILKQKLAKRQVSLKLCEFQDPKAVGGDMIRQVVRVKDGLQEEELKKLTKMIKQTKMKVQPQIQGEQVRVSGKKRDVLQEVISYLKSNATEFELQFVNFRD